MLPDNKLENIDLRIDCVFAKIHEAFLTELRFAARKHVKQTGEHSSIGVTILVIITGALLLVLYFLALLPFLFCFRRESFDYLLDNSNYHNDKICQALNAKIIRRKKTLLNRQLIVSEVAFVWFSRLVGRSDFENYVIRGVFKLVVKAFFGHLSTIGQYLVNRHKSFIFIKNNNAVFSCVFTKVCQRNDIKVYCVPHGLVTTLRCCPELRKLSQTIIGDVDKVVVRSDIWPDLLPEHDVINHIDGTSLLDILQSNVTERSSEANNKIGRFQILIADTVKEIDKRRNNAYPTSSELLNLYANIARDLTKISKKVSIVLSCRTQDEAFVNNIKSIFGSYEICVRSNVQIDTLLRDADCLLTSGSTVIEDAIVAGKRVFLTSNQYNEFYYLFTTRLRLPEVRPLPQVINCLNDLM